MSELKTNTYVVLKDSSDFKCQSLNANGAKMWGITEPYRGVVPHWVAVKWSDGNSNNYPSADLHVLKTPVVPKGWKLSGEYRIINKGEDRLARNGKTIYTNMKYSTTESYFHIIGDEQKSETQEDIVTKLKAEIVNLSLQISNLSKDLKDRARDISNRDNTIGYLENLVTEKTKTVKHVADKLEESRKTTNQILERSSKTQKKLNQAINEIQVLAEVHYKSANKNKLFSYLFGRDA